MSDITQDVIGFICGEQNLSESRVSTSEFLQIQYFSRVIFQILFWEAAGLFFLHRIGKIGMLQKDWKLTELI